VIGVIGRVVEAVSGMDNATQAALAVVALWLAWRRLGRFIMAAALFAALEDIGAWMEGQPSLIGKLLPPYEEFAEAISNVVDALGGFERIIQVIIGLALLKWIAGVTGAVRALAVALGFAGALLRPLGQRVQRLVQLGAHRLGRLLLGLWAAFCGVCWALQPLRPRLRLVGPQGS